MSSEIFINITKEKKEMTNVQLENEIDCKRFFRYIFETRLALGCGTGYYFCCILEPKAESVVVRRHHTTTMYTWTQRPIVTRYRG